MNDILFSPGIIIQIALAVIGVATLLVLRDTLKEIGKQASAAVTSADTAREEFLLTHRPRLIIRHVVLPIGYTLELSDGSFDVANVGDMPAVIVNAHCQILIAEGLPMRRPYDDNHIGNIKADFIETNSGAEVRLDIPDRVSLNGTEYKDIQNAIEIVEKLNELPMEIKRSVYVLGYVRYVDRKHKNPRRTVFARVFDYKTRRFIPIEHSDYEYAD